MGGLPPMNIMNIMNWCRISSIHSLSLFMLSSRL